jgi:hypothetical protein
MLFDMSTTRNKHFHQSGYINHPLYQEITMQTCMAELQKGNSTK